MKTCYSCQKEINSQNESSEHIIINAIGGKLKSKKILCKICNTKLGDKYDRALAEAYNVLAHNLEISRERGKVPDVLGELESGAKVTVPADGAPKLHKARVDIEEKDGKKEFKISARNIKEAQKILKGVKDKYKISDEYYDELLSGMKSEKINDTGFIKYSLQIGGDDIFKAILKALVGYYTYLDQDISNIEDCVRELKNDKNKTNRIWFLNQEHLLAPYEKRSICHTLQIISNVSQKQLIGIYDIFSVCQYGVILSEDYNGPEIRKSYSYCFDLKKEIELSTLDVETVSEVISLIKASEYDYDALKKRMHRFLGITAGKKEIKHKSGQGVDKAFEYINTQLTDEQKNDPKLISSILASYVVDEFKENIAAASEQRMREAEEAFIADMKKKTKNK